MLRDASDIALSRSYQDALAFLDLHGSPETRFTRHLLQANASLHEDTAWLAGLNAYLAQFKLSPVVLQPGDRNGRFLRLSARQASAVTHGPRVSVIMTAFNAEDTLTHAVLSILGQTWRNLELIVVDDASTDSTWAMLQSLAAADPRMRLLRSRVNVGPYVGRNHALSVATGDFITCHDADDWAHPQRIERQMASLTSKRGAKATWSSMLRLRRDGHLPGFGPISRWSFDGAARLASVSALFEKRWFDLNLGHWDSVRFAADSELIGRARLLLGNKFRTDRVVSMLCLSSDTSLTGAEQTGLGSAVRMQYRARWQKWHSTLRQGDAYIAFPQTQRKFEAPLSMLANQAEIHPVECEGKSANET
ncbi:glycosyltransferase family 2 protein [Hyphomicrobium sp.]|uniref:glycosyltransferase family 2 protein n=1 Tax=Hyphomicrobium sp. TaxID=82 RepID=UPI002E33F84B|nr:glycosyltransferase family 2 protein [Hyphomicrobium sp.]HEX2841172.1 glycosyltransferase family 2 protein [Hyphomicrobium sp.]